jgi:hypothetical protein
MRPRTNRITELIDDAAAQPGRVAHRRPDRGGLAADLAADLLAGEPAAATADGN